jgi:hypothetical protein
MMQGCLAYPQQQQQAASSGLILARVDTKFFCLPLYGSANIDISITDRNRKNFLEFDTSNFRVT